MYSSQEKRYEPPLLTEQIRVDRKVFFLDLKENDRGRYLKITEEANGRRDMIVVPMAGIPEMIEALHRLVEGEQTL